MNDGGQRQLDAPVRGAEQPALLAGNAQDVRMYPDLDLASERGDFDRPVLAVDQAGAAGEPGGRIAATLHRIERAGARRPAEQIGDGQAGSVAGFEFVPTGQSLLDAQPDDGASVVRTDTAALVQDMVCQRIHVVGSPRGASCGQA